MSKSHGSQVLNAQEIIQRREWSLIGIRDLEIIVVVVLAIIPVLAKYP